MRRAARIDGNHAEVTAYLRLHGATVQSLASMGRGCPDLLVGFNGKNWLLEVKDGTLPPSRQVLTVDEINWLGGWRGQACVVNSPDVALAVVQGRHKL